MTLSNREMRQRRSSQLLLLMVFLHCMICLSSCILMSAHAEELELPVLVGQTGASALFGHNELNAYRLAVEEWNSRGGVGGKKLKLLVEDTHTSQTTTITAFHRLVSHGSTVVLGATWLDGLQGLIPIARKRGVLLVTPSAAPETFGPENRDWPISFYHNTTTETEALVKYLSEQGAQRVALVHEEEPFTELLKKLTIQAGIKPVETVAAQAGEVDFQAAVIKLRSAKPDVILVFLWDERSLFALLKQLKLLLPSIPLATIHDGIGWTKTAALAPVLSKLTYTEFELADRSFATRYKARFNEEPQLTASNAYDAINSVLSAFAAGHIDANSVRSYLQSTELPSVTFGAFRFSVTGQVPSRISVRAFSRK